MTGTFINIATILLGSSVGILFRSRLPERYIKIIFQGLGLFTLFLGVTMSGSSENVLIMVSSIVLGGLTGEALQLEERLEHLSETARVKFKLGDKRFSEGAITAFLLFCIGSMTIMGAIEDGLGKPPKLLITKAVLDCFASMALASAYGMGVAFSVVPLLIFQGGISLLAMHLGSSIEEGMIQEMTAVGGILIIGLGINMLDIKKLKIMNLLPGLIYAVLLWYGVNFYKMLF